jgi:predicted RNA-binding protein with PIN domain
MEALVPYIVDGNNLLGSWGGPRGLDDRRGEVVRRVAAFCRARRVRATLVFDGHQLRPDMATQDFGGLTVRVPPPGQDADTLIREVLERVARPAEWILVTSDKALYSYCKTLGAQVLRAHEWNAIERRQLSAQTEVPGAEKPEREADVEGWLERFGSSE